jgi:hypothetical protein
VEKRGVTMINPIWLCEEGYDLKVISGIPSAAVNDLVNNRGTNLKWILPDNLTELLNEKKVEWINDVRTMKGKFCLNGAGLTRGTDLSDKNEKKRLSV